MFFAPCKHASSKHASVMPVLCHISDQSLYVD